MTRSLALLLLATPLTAAAQDIDADTFDLSGSAFDDEGTLQLVHPHIGWPSSFYAGLGFVYSHQPLVYRLDDGSKQVLVDGQFSTRVAGGFNLLGAARIDLEVPLFPYNSVDGQSAFSMGDIRLGAVVPIVKYEESGFGVGVSPFVSLPTGSKGTWVTGGGFSGGAIATVGGKAGILNYALNVGADLGGASTVRDVKMGSSLLTGLGFSFDVADPVVIGVEVDSSMDLVDGSPWNETPTEAHLFATYNKGSGVTATLAGGTGIIPGVGAPSFRTVFLVGYRAPGKAPVHDLDGDGLEDDVDQCPENPEDIDEFADKDGCPDPDNDKDGLLDTNDQCPNEAEDFDKFGDEDGCPDPDNDKDGILDDADQCPNVKGVQALNGCPDRDGDGITDTADACPDEPGPENTQGCPDRDSDRVPDSCDKCPDVPADPRIDPRRSDGCPARVIVTKNAIQILDKIYFDTNKTTIKKVSYTLLDEIAKVINDNPDIKLIEVSGHTDSVGNDAANLKLSQGRAEAVVKHLVTIGKVDAARLTPKGYGETKPIDTNDTDAGKAMNRRVEFNILEQ